MAGYSGLTHRATNRFFSINQDVMEILGGDWISVAFLDVLLFRSTIELQSIYGKGNEPKEWPDDLWVKRDMAAFVENWMFGAVSVRALQPRIEWLESLRLIKTRRTNNSTAREYWLDVPLLNESIRVGRRLGDLEVFQGSRSADLPRAIGKTIGKSADRSFIYKSIEPSSLNQSSTSLEDSINNQDAEEFRGTEPSATPEEEGTAAQTQRDREELGGRRVEDGESECVGVAPPSADPNIDAGLHTSSLEDEIDTDTPIEKFCRHRCQRLGMRDPKLGTQANRELRDWLLRHEEQFGSLNFRSAIVRWLLENQDWVRDWLKERIRHRQPFHHFRKAYTDYLGPQTMDPLSTGNPQVVQRKTQADYEQLSTNGQLLYNNSDNVHSGNLKQEPSRTNPASNPAVDPYPTPENLVAGWNGAVPSRLFEEPTPPGATSVRNAVNRGLTLEVWKVAAAKAEQIIQAKGDEARWLTLRWALKSDPEKGDNWRRLATGEFNFMAAGKIAATGKERASPAYKDPIEGQLDRFKERLRKKRAQENQNAEDED